MRLGNVRSLAILGLVLACCLPATATVKMTQTVVFHGYGPSNAGRSRATTSTLIQGVRSRTETSMEFEGKLLKRLTGTQVDISITDLEDKVMRTLNPKRETYSEITFEQFLAQRDQVTEQLAALRGQTAQRPEGEEPSRPAMEFGPPEITVKEAGSARIAGYDARLLDVLVKMIGRYPETTDTCEIHVQADLGFAETPGTDEIQAFHTKLAEELGFSKAQMLGAGQSMLAAMGNYAEGFDKLFEEIRKQKGTLVRQNMRVQVRGACGGPPPADGAAGASASSPSGQPGGEAEPVAPGARVKKMFGKLKLGRKKRGQEPQEETPAATAPAAAPGDAFMTMLAVDMETDTYETIDDVGADMFVAPATWKKVEARGLGGDER